ncbi:MAG: hypothetical protein ASARMPRED_006889 [Alectoria sarmentosa]|nr:MAG: hypothetical protein ASARMPRED_006889 [Alectoria sarmentosa]
MKETAATEKEKLMNPRKEDTRAISGPTVNSVNLESLEQAIEHMPLGLDDSKESRLLTDDNDRDADAVCGDDVCGARPAGQCTCERAKDENAKLTGSTCACGARPANACSCEKAADGGVLPTETDFTTKAAGA